MKIQKITALLGASVLSISLASSAAALSVNLDTGVNVQTNVGGSASANASTSDSATVSATNAVASNTSAGSSANANADVSANLTPLYVTQADVSAGMVSPTSDNAASVQSSSDLSGYAAARLQDDSAISQIQASPANVAVTYNEPAKALGIFPVNVQATASVTNDGTVDISYPWYAFLFSTDASTLQTQVQSRVSADLGGSASAQTGFSAQQQAKLIADISSVMQSEADVSANAAATASTNIQ